MKKCKLFLTISIIVCSLFLVTGCETDKKQENEKTNPTGEIYTIDNNDIYYVSIDGNKFKAGDKISSVSKVNLKQKEKNLDQEIPKNRYLLSQAVIDSENNEICKFIPLNSTDSEITVRDAVIGGFEVGDYNYSKISEKTLSHNIEVIGGIKLGSSYQDLVKVLGEENYKFEHKATELLPAYTTYKYSKGYKGYEFIIDDSGKISKINWNNYDYTK